MPAPREVHLLAVATSLGRRCHLPAASSAMMMACQWPGPGGLRLALAAAGGLPVAGEPAFIEV